MANKKQVIRNPKFVLTAEIVKRVRSWQKPFRVMCIHYPSASKQVKEMVQDLHEHRFIRLAVVPKKKSVHYIYLEPKFEEEAVFLEFQEDPLPI